MPNAHALIAGSALALVILSSLADHRRARRIHLDRVGFMPWTAITVIATVVFAVFAGLALRG